jgi:hypothetical protein
MFQDNKGDDDQDLPWDPMWEYVLGEDEMDDRDDDDRRCLYSPREDRRDFLLGEATNAICGTGILNFVSTPEGECFNGRHTKQC